MIYAYAIIDSNLKVGDPVSGLEDTLVYNIPYRDVGVVVSELKEEIKDITQEHILAHEQVAERLMQHFTVLPVSFFTIFNTKEEVFDMMKEYYKDFVENLKRLRNKVEFGIRVIWPANTIRQRIVNSHSKDVDGILSSSNSAGMRFIKEKFSEYEIEKELQEEAKRCITVVDDYFNKIVVEKKLRKLQTESLLLNVSYLVENEKQEEFKRTFEQLKSSPSDLKFLFSGPWPPYNFVNLTQKTDSAMKFNIETLFSRKSMAQELQDK